MKPNEIIKDIMKVRGYSNKSLADKLGKSTASAISNPLSRENGMRIDTFLEMIEAMDCEVVIKSKLKDKTEWKMESKPMVLDTPSFDKEVEKHENTPCEKRNGRIKLTKGESL